MLVHLSTSVAPVTTFTSFSRMNQLLGNVSRYDGFLALKVFSHLQANIPHSQLADQIHVSSPTTPYRRVLLRGFDQCEALRTARPYSASILAFAESFCYNQGVLVYSYRHEVRILDVHNRARLERVISCQDFANQLRKSGEGSNWSSDLSDRVSILGYCDGVAAVLYESDHVTGRWLFAVDVRQSRGTESRSRFLWRRRLASVAKLFVRCNASYLYFGTHSVMGRQDHHEWLIHGFDLMTGNSVTPQPIRLDGFVGSEIGSTAEFTIHGDCFYAVSNQSSHESVEIDWTSYYNYICFPLFHHKPDVRIKNIYRRQHREGPINDDFTNLSLQVDPQTNDLLIIECRKEWLGGGSTSIRTYYTTKFPPLGHEEPERRDDYPPNDPLSRIADKDGNWRYEPGKPRACRHMHQDHTGDQKYDFIRAKTKYHGYNSSAHSFLDLVSESVPVPGSSRPRERIRLRVASRVPKSPLEPDTDNPGQFVLRKPLLDKDDMVVKDSEEDFQPTEAHLWPPKDAPDELFDILCPGGRAGTVHAVLDDRSIVYMVGPPRANSEGRAIVMVSFDPTWGFKGMRRWGGRENVETRDIEVKRLDPQMDIDFPMRLKRKSESSPTTTVSIGVDLPDWSSSLETGPVGKRQKREGSPATAVSIGVDLLDESSLLETGPVWKKQRRQKREGSPATTVSIGVDLPDWSSSLETGPVGKRQKCEGALSSAAVVPGKEDRSSSPRQPRHLRTGEAMYWSIRQGFWLR
jgi:hypothetical protein